MLSPIIKKKIEAKFGSPIRYPKDCDALASDMSAHCKCKISGSTIKRLFGLIKGTETPREYTLDLIALYLGEDSWAALVNQIVENKPGAKKIDQIISKSLRRGIVIKISCGKKASVTIEYIGKDKFIVVDQKGTLLHKTDILEIEKIQLHFPVLIKNIRRNLEILESVLIGSVTGVTDITVVNQESKIVSSTKLQINSVN